MQLTLPDCDVLCVYGRPNDELLKDLKLWVNEVEERFVVVLSDDEKGELPEKFRFCSCDEESLKKMAWEFVFLRFGYLQHESSEEMKLIFTKVSEWQEGIHLVASDFQHRGIDRLKNLMQNSSSFDRSRDGQKLFGAFSKVPAIICGAGPSLEKEMPYLKTLKDRALIFGGGTALSSLSHFGMKPHFAGHIDPYEPSPRFHENNSFQVPCFFQNRVHPSKLSAMHGPLFWMPGSGNDLFEEETFDGGWNVSTFLTAIACHLGCSPIILVGVDLSQEKDKSYAGDFERLESGELIKLEDGKYSRSDWLVAAKWLSEFSNQHPEVDWFNASSGLEIAGFETKNLHEISFETQEDLMGQIHSFTMQILPGVMSQFDKGMLRKSIQKVGDICSEMLALLEKLYPKPPEKEGAYTLLQCDLENEIAYQQFLRPVWEIWKHVLARKLPEGIPHAYGIGLNQWLFLKEICDDAGRI